MNKEMKNLMPEDILTMSYNEIIGLTRETNRTPGGLDTIKEVARLLLVNENTKLLDIGTSTGHTALEFARLTNCTVVGIDINPVSLAVARERAEALALNKVKFEEQDATNMSFASESFDVVFAGNVTSLINDRRSALKEYWRVLRPNGFLVAVPMYYLETPSDDLLNQVRDAIQVNISAYYKEDWKTFFVTKNVELYESADYKFIKSSEEEITQFCSLLLSREHLNSLRADTKAVLEERYCEYMRLFNENLSHMGFTVFVLRRKESERFNDPQLYRSEKI